MKLMKSYILTARNKNIQQICSRVLLKVQLVRYLSKTTGLVISEYSISILKIDNGHWKIFLNILKQKFRIHQNFLI